MPDTSIPAGEAAQLPGDAVSVLVLLDDAGGCEKFAQRLLGFGPGHSATRRESNDDEVLYVLDGSGTLAVVEEEFELAPGAGVFLRRGTPWSVTCARPLRLLSVLVHAPVYSPCTHARIDLAAEVAFAASGARRTVLGMRPELGCATVTQFLTSIPPGRAPDHYHLFDELIYVLAGRGVAHVGGGESAPLAPGVSLHLPARRVHSLENCGDEPLALLGVLTPAGSPEAAYHPDGTSALYPQES